MNDFLQRLRLDIQNAQWTEYVAVIAGIASVWLSKIENIWVYPVGLVNTVIYIYICITGDLFGEAAVNVYYTIMSIYGWIIWARRNDQQQHVLQVSGSTSKELMTQLAFFLAFYVAIYAALHYARSAFYANTLPLADAFASASAFTGMWLMARKKVESWYWWIVTNMASIPLFYYKGYALTSALYVILLVMAFFGLADWRNRARKARAIPAEPAFHG